MKMLSAHRSGPHQKSGREIGCNNVTWPWQPMKMLSAHRSGPHQKSGREIGRNNGGSGLRNSIPIKHLSCYWRFDSPTNSTDEAIFEYPDESEIPAHGAIQIGGHKGSLVRVRLAAIGRL